MDTLNTHTLSLSPPSQIHSLTHSLTHRLPHTYSRMHSLTYSLTHSNTHICAEKKRREREREGGRNGYTQHTHTLSSLTNSLTHTFTHSLILTHSHIQSHIQSHTHTLIRNSFTHLFPHTCTQTHTQTHSHMLTHRKSLTHTHTHLETPKLTQSLIHRFTEPAFLVNFGVLVFFTVFFLFSFELDLVATLTELRPLLVNFSCCGLGEMSRSFFNFVFLLEGKFISSTCEKLDANASSEECLFFPLVVMTLLVYKIKSVCDELGIESALKRRNICLFKNNSRRS